MSFRKILFWLHLIAGVVAGVVILVMSVTGAALAFEKEIIAWAERDVRRSIPPTSDATPLPLSELLAKAQEKKPGERPTGVTMEVDPKTALMVSYGRTNTYYVNRFTGEVHDQGAQGVRAFMHVMIDWHRFLGGHDERRAIGKAVTGASNVAFAFLAISGLYLWWPRKWTMKMLRTIGVMNFKLRGKARDWNWHNAVGFWTAPVLIVLTVTAMPISYRWAGDLIYKLTGTPVPELGAGPGGAAASPAIEVPTPPPGTRPLGLDALFAAAQKEFPNWEQISQRPARGAGGPRGMGGRTNEVGRAAGTNQPAASDAAAGTNAVAGEGRGRRGRGGEGVREGGAREGGGREGRGEGGGREGRGEGRGPAQPVTLTVIEKGNWPLFSNLQVTFDPFTGAVLRKEGFGDYNLGRQVRSWTRYLHTGEALGTVGKTLAGVASAGGALLVWTGFALAWRRFFPGRGKNQEEMAEEVEVPALQAAAKE